MSNEYDHPIPAAPLSDESRVDDGVSRRLDPRIVPVQRIGRTIFIVVNLFGSLPILVASILFGAGGGLRGLLLAAAWVVAAGLLTWWALGWPALAYRYASYAVDTAGIEIRRGVVWRRVIHVPRSRVQHTDVSQGPIQRSYGIGTLVIYTAGTDFARVHLAGLDHGTALRIRDHLLPDAGPDAV
jgi:membrane protein YdbS with pleckstrin-like domain